MKQWPDWTSLSDAFASRAPADAPSRRLADLKDPERFRLMRKLKEKLGPPIARLTGNPGYVRFATAAWGELVDLLRDQVARDEVVRARLSRRRPPTPRCDFGIVRKHNQLPCTPENLVERAEWVERLCSREAPVLVVGDDDRLSLELARRGFVDVTVVDIDETLVASIAHEAIEAGLSLRALRHDLSQPPVRELVRRYELVTMDPICTPDGLELFVSGSMALLDPRATAKFFVCTHLLSQLRDGLERLPALCERHNLVLEELDLGFAVYESPESARRFLKGVLTLFEAVVPRKDRLGLSGCVPQYFVSDAMVLKRDPSRSTAPPRGH